MHTPAWNVDDLWALTLDPDVVTGDVTVPFVSGRVSLPFEIDSTTYQMPLALCGEIDWLGAGYTDDEAGLAANLAYLKTNVFYWTDPANFPNGYVTGIFDAPSGTHSASVHIGPLTYTGSVVNTLMGDGVKRRAAAMTFNLTVPQGAFIMPTDVDSFIT